MRMSHVYDAVDLNDTNEQLVHRQLDRSCRNQS